MAHGTRDFLPPQVPGGRMWQVFVVSGTSRVVKHDKRN